MAGDPLQRGIADDDIDVRVGLPVLDGRDAETGTGHRGRLGNHLGGGIEALYPGRRPAGGEQRREIARPASQIDHPAGCDRVDPGDEVEERAAALAGVPRVLRNVPSHGNPLDIERVCLGVKRMCRDRWHDARMADEVDRLVEAWRRERPDLDVGPLQILSRIARLAMVLDERRSAAFVEHGLQAHEFDVLAALRRTGEPFELTAGQLCLANHVTSGTMTSRLDRLADRRLVQRRADAVDGRLVRVRLTVPGRKRVDSAFSALLASERELLDRLPLAKRERLASILRDLLVATTG